MPWTLSAVPERHFVRLTFDGQVDAAARGEAYAALAALAAQCRATRALIDVAAMRATYATMVSYDHAVQLAARLPHGLRLAVLLSDDRAQFGAASFVRDVASNRGLVLELFERSADALAWLDADDDRVAAEVA